MSVWRKQFPEKPISYEELLVKVELAKTNIYKALKNIRWQKKDSGQGSTNQDTTPFWDFIVTESSSQL